MEDGDNNALLRTGHGPAAILLVGVVLGGNPDTAETEPGCFFVVTEGCQHQPGIRNVLLVKRFEPAAEPDGLHRPIQLPQLAVESEVVPQ